MEQPLFGRTPEAAVLAAAIDGLSGRSGGVLWVDGEPGIGKTVLVRAALERLPAGNTRLWGYASRLAEQFPLSALATALNITTRSSDPARAEAARLLRGLHAARPTTDPLLAAADRMLDVVSTEVSRGPVVLVLDDVHWADDLSLRMLTRLLYETSSLPLLMILIGQAGALRPPVEELRHDALATGSGLTLRPIGATALADLAQARVGARVGASLRRELARSGGNPFYATELLRHLEAGDAIRLVDGIAEVGSRDHTVPESLGASIDQWLDQVTEGDRELLELAAHLGGPFTTDDLTVAAGRPPHELPSLLKSGLLIVGDDGQIAFRHGLIADRVQAAVARPVSQDIHRRIAQRLWDADARPSRIAQHLIAAGPTGTPLATSWLPTLSADELLTFADTADQLLEPVLAAGALAPAARHRLAAARAELLAWTDKDPRDQLQMLIDQSEDPDEIGRLSIGLARAWGRAGQPTAALDILRAAAARPGLRAATSAQLAAWTALGKSMTGEPGATSALKVALDALDQAVASGDPVAIATAHHVVSKQSSASSRMRIEHMRRGLAVLGDSVEETDLRFMMMSNLLIDLSIAGKWDLEPEIEAALHEAEARGSRMAHLLRRMLIGDAFAIGDWDRALAHCKALEYDLFDQHYSSADTGAKIHFMRDEPGPARELFARWGELDHVNETAVAVIERLVAGDRPGALEQARRWPRVRIQFDLLWPDWDAPLLASLSVEAGDRTTPRQVVATRAAQMAAAELPDDPMQRYLQAIAEQDGTALARASTELHETGLLPLAGFAAMDGALAYARNAEPDAARDQLARAVEIFETLGARWAVRFAEARLREHGVRRGPRAAARPPHGPAELTPTETVIAGLIAEGASNPEIAARLLISRRTVEVHVSRILTKLDIRTRHDVAAAIERRRL